MVQTRTLRNILEASRAVVEKQLVRGADPCQIQIGITIVINVGKRGGNTSSVAPPRRPRYVLQRYRRPDSPQFVGTQLADEIDVQQSIVVDVSDRDSAAVIIVGTLKVLVTSSTTLSTKLILLLSI